MVNMAPFFFFFKPGTMSSFTMKFSWCFEKLMFCSFIYSFIHLLPCKSITKDHPSWSYDYCYCSDVATCIMCVWTVKHCGNVCVCRKSHRSSKNQGWVCSHILCCKLPIFFFTSERERERERERVRERERENVYVHSFFVLHMRHYVHYLPWTCVKIKNSGIFMIYLMYSTTIQSFNLVWHKY